MSPPGGGFGGGPPQSGFGGGRPPMGGGGGFEGSAVASWADGDVATVEDEGVAATGSVDEGFLTNLGVVVVAGAARDKARACSTRITSRRPLAFCIEF